MVVKSKLKSELEEYNKNLDKHLREVSLDEYEEKSLSTPSYMQDSSEMNLLLSQALTDIRLEMNLMRKNLSSDLSSMIRKEINLVDRKISETNSQFQTQLLEVSKIHLRSPLKEITSSFDDIKNQIKNMQEDFSNLSKELSNNSGDKNSSLLLNFEKLESNLHSLISDSTLQSNLINDKIRAFENKLTNIELILSDDFSAFKSQFDSESKLFENKEEVHLSLPKVEKELSVPESKPISMPHIPRSNSNKTTRKILDIEERLKKLHEIKV